MTGLWHVGFTVSLCIESVCQLALRESLCSINRATIVKITIHQRNVLSSMKVSMDPLYVTQRELIVSLILDATCCIDTNCWRMRFITFNVTVLRGRLEHYEQREHSVLYHQVKNIVERYIISVNLIVFNMSYRNVSPTSHPAPVTKESCIHTSCILLYVWGSAIHVVIGL